VRRRRCASALVAAAIFVGASQAPPATGAIPARWKSCKVVNKRFPHGVGKLRAHDRTKSGDPVTNFRRSTRLYLEAMRHNKRLDADKDGIACEKH
jgi:hypothetical protein